MTQAFLDACLIRDRLVDQLRDRVTDDEKVAWVHYLVYGTDRENVPMPLVRAQDEVMRCLELLKE